MTILDSIKDYWNKQPCNIFHGKSELGTKNWYNEIREKRYSVEPHVYSFPEFPKWKNKNVLEIGCGLGIDAMEFAKYGANYTGIDLSVVSVNLAKRGFELFGLRGELLQSDARDLPNFNKKFDLVYSCGVLHHFPEPEKAIEQIHNLLNPNGEFRFLVYAKNSWKYAMIQNGLDQFEAQANCPYATAYTNNEINDLLLGKFEIKSIIQDHCFMYNVKKYKQHVFELEPWFAAMSQEMRDTIKTKLGWHLLVTAVKI